MAANTVRSCCPQFFILSTSDSVVNGEKACALPFGDLLSSAKADRVLVSCELYREQFVQAGSSGLISNVLCREVIRKKCD